MRESISDDFPKNKTPASFETGVFNLNPAADYSPARSKSGRAKAQGVLLLALQPTPLKVIPKQNPRLFRDGGL